MPPLIFVPILGYALFVSRRFQKGPGAAIFFSVCFQLVALYGFACVGLLRPGAHLLVLVGSLLFAILLIRGWALGRSLLFSPPAVLLVVGGIAYWLIFREARYFFWDEFSQWGTATRELFFTHKLYGPGSNVLYPETPPGLALWHYLVCVNTHYSEGDTYFAQFVLLITPTLPLYERTSFKRPHWIVLAGSLELLLLANLGLGTMLYADHIVSTLFAGVLLTYLSDENPLRAPALYALPLAALSLAKDVGFLFALAASGFLLVHWALTREPDPKVRPRPGWRVRWIGIVAVALAPLVTTGTWHLKLAQMGVPTTSSSVARVWHAVSPDSGSRTATTATLTAKHFMEALWRQPLSRSKISEDFNEWSYQLLPLYSGRFHLTAVGWLVFVVGALGLRWVTDKDRRSRRSLLLVAGFLLGLTGAYLLALARHYQVMERPSLPSYDRYVNTVMLAVVMVTLGHFLFFRSRRLSPHPGPRAWADFVWLTLMVCLLYAVEPPYLRQLYVPRKAHPFRIFVEETTEAFRLSLGTGSTLFILFPIEENGFMRFMMKYQLTPVRVTISSHDFARLDDAHVRRLIGAHDYAWFPVPDRDVTVLLSRLFGIDSPDPLRFYRIEHAEAGVRLVPVGEGHR